MSVAEAVERAHREEWARVLAAVVRLTRDLDLAEECVQDAFAQALRTWPDTGVPDRPGAWLTTVARNRAVDRLRRETALRRMLPLLVTDDIAPPADDRLGLILMCCHPALSRDAQVALTLRLVCGLSTADVARVYLVPEPTMAARITRAKRKIATARIPFRVPGPDELPARVQAACEVVHLVFTTGHTAPSGPELQRTDLTDSAIAVARMLRLQLPRDPEVAALLALLLLIDARRTTRTTPDGRLLLLSEQDRSQWDGARIAEGTALLGEALRRPPTRWAVEAAIAAVHAESPSWEATDWSEICGLYAALADLWPSPVVTLNHAVALGLRDGPEAGLAALEPLLSEPSLAGYGYLAAARADFLRRLGRREEAALAYEEALALTANESERAFLTARLADLDHPQ
ncbi:RNA polymerase sigma factor [Dactylosporangium sp. CS-033363]|uniref:RNA polymerase sigma factor n=1 Tax=Dactylosporangium sp. CS-033363 TaxID=3239935 RepID=UPI003D89E2EE